MKSLIILKYLLLLSLISLSEEKINSICEGESTGLDYCKTLEPINEQVKCCFIHYVITKGEETRVMDACRGVTQEELNDIPSTIEKWKDEAREQGFNITTLSLDCGGEADTTDHNPPDTSDHNPPDTTDHTQPDTSDHNPPDTSDNNSSNFLSLSLFIFISLVLF